MEKYRATIHGNVIEWEDDAPRELAKKGRLEVEVHVVPRLKPIPAARRRKMADALEELAALPNGALKSIKDPVKWQRQVRKDRPLPGR
jgi:hypothetical protein